LKERREVFLGDEKLIRSKREKKEKKGGLVQGSKTSSAPEGRLIIIGGGRMEREKEPRDQQP